MTDRNFETAFEDDASRVDERSHHEEEEGLEASAKKPGEDDMLSLDAQEQELLRNMQDMEVRNDGAIEE